MMVERGKAIGELREMRARELGPETAIIAPTV